MQEIVSKVLDAEKEAEQGIQNARTEATEIRARADGDVQRMQEAAREQAAAASERILEQARGEARKEYEQAVKRAAEENRVFFERHETEIGGAVKAVYRLISTPVWADER